jgi:hypothetical protein
MLHPFINISVRYAMYCWRKWKRRLNMSDAVRKLELIPNSCLKFYVAGFILLCVVSGCGRNERAAKLREAHSRALKSGLETIPSVKEFIDLYPDCDNYFSYFTGEAGTTTWRSRTGLYGRYILDMSVEVELDDSRSNVTAFGEPHFSLVEIRNINSGPEGSAEIFYTDCQLRFGPKEWEKVVKTRGDLSVLGLEVVKDHPVPGFSAHWRGG